MFWVTMGMYPQHSGSELFGGHPEGIGDGISVPRWTRSLGLFAYLMSLSQDKENEVSLTF